MAGHTPYGFAGAVTDDTQMTLFTAEGLLRAYSRQTNKGICDIPSVIHHAYIRWLMTQGETAPAARDKSKDGWLFGIPALHARRAPGNTCLSALRASAHFGDGAVNDSKGCGGVMRVAPIAIFAAAQGMGPRWAFDLGAETSRLTHGHPSGYWSGAALAFLITRILEGATPEHAASDALEALRAEPSMRETHDALTLALNLASSAGDTEADIRRLGEGWTGEEALAIAVYCCLRADSLQEALILAANHDGDTDSTAAIAGNILGAADGQKAIPQEWAEQVELRDVIERIATDLVHADKAIQNWDDYPGW